MSTNAAPIALLLYKKLNNCNHPDATTSALKNVFLLRISRIYSKINKAALQGAAQLPNSVETVASDSFETLQTLQSKDPS